MNNLVKNFKKLTIFDRIIIGLSVLGFLFLAYVSFRKTTYTTVVVKVGEDNIVYAPWVAGLGTRPWFEQSFYPGMAQKDGLGRIVAEVESIRSYDTLPSRRAVYLTVKLNATSSRSTKQYTFNGKPLVMGSSIKLDFEKFQVEGLVTYVEGVKDPRVKKKLVVEAQVRNETNVYPETSGVSDYIARAINTGDEYKDSQGNVLIKILDKKSEPAKKLVTTSDGRVLIQTDPLHRDVYLSLEINAVKIGDRYYVFDDVPILVGFGIPINTPTISILPEVTKITPVD